MAKKREECAEAQRQEVEVLEAIFGVLTTTHPQPFGSAFLACIIFLINRNYFLIFWCTCILLFSGRRAKNPCLFLLFTSLGPDRRGMKDEELIIKHFTIDFIR